MAQLVKVGRANAKSYDKTKLFILSGSQETLPPTSPLNEKTDDNQRLEAISWPCMSQQRC